MEFARRCGWVTYEPFKMATAKTWSPIAFFFCLMLVSSFKSYQYMQVPMVRVFFVSHFHTKLEWFVCHYTKIKFFSVFCSLESSSFRSCLGIWSDWPHCSQMNTEYVYVFFSCFFSRVCCVEVAFPSLRYLDYSSWWIFLWKSVVDTATLWVWDGYVNNTMK